MRHQCTNPRDMLGARLGQIDRITITFGKGPTINNLISQEREPILHRASNLRKGPIWSASLATRHRKSGARLTCGEGRNGLRRMPSHLLPQGEQLTCRLETP